MQITICKVHQRFQAFAGLKILAEQQAGACQPM